MNHTQRGVAGPLTVQPPGGITKSPDITVSPLNLHGVPGLDFGLSRPYPCTVEQLSTIVLSSSHVQEVEGINACFWDFNPLLLGYTSSLHLQEAFLLLTYKKTCRTSEQAIFAIFGDKTSATYDSCLQSEQANRQFIEKPRNSQRTSFECCLMPLLKYFLVIGTLLSLLLCAWSEYLTPPEAEIQRTTAPAKTVEVFRPTPAPPITEAERPAFAEASEPPVISGEGKGAHQAASAKPRRSKAQAAHRRAAHRDSFAYAYLPRPQLFFGWR